MMVEESRMLQVSVFHTLLLPRKFTHSWNGKYRRLVGLDTPDFATQVKGELLWV
jgi:predicted metalloprotease with PDZ domain